jgi:phosphoribosylformylglycinamidine synthase
LDLEAVDAAATAVRELVAAGLVQGAHDVSRGGVALALAEMAVRSGVGFTAARLADHRDLFSESSGRAVLCVDPEQLRVVLDVLEARGVPHSRLGVAGGDRMVVKDQLDLALDDATAAYRDRLPDALGSGTTQG